MSECLLEARDLSRRFGGLAAVDGVSLDVVAGQVLGVIGPNGAGKSTLINLLTGHLRPTAGTVKVGGRNVAGARPWTIARARVARTFQLVKPFPALTVRENVALGLMFGPARDRSVRSAIARADGVLERVGLHERAAAHPSELSVGDARRLELAKALALDPRVLLLDEVMAGLRPNEIDSTLALLRELRDEGLGLLVVEHNVRAIAEVSDTLLVLHHGKELAAGEPQRVLADEQVIRAYLGERWLERRGDPRRGGRAADA